MPVFSYEYPKAILDILQDAKPVEPGRHHGNSTEGSMYLFRGKAGRFIVHLRHDREAPVPVVRLMQIPDEVTDAESIQYAQAHPEAFSRWYMTYLQ